MIDIHSHILPGVDDGSKSWETSREMCRMAAADGIEHMVATPHANDHYCYNRDHLTNLLEQLKQESGGRPCLGLGCDFHLSYDNLTDLRLHPQKYLIEGSHYLLVELSNFAVPAQMDDCFAQMIETGTVPVITHPERNPVLRRTPQRVLRWAQLGCAVQVTAGVLTGLWGEGTRRAANWLFDRDAVHVLATDAHDTKRRVPILSAARDEVAKTYGQDVADALVDANPRAVISDQPLPYFPAPKVGR